jgi:lipoprotein-releasing system permease protein
VRGAAFAVLTALLTPLTPAVFALGVQLMVQGRPPFANLLALKPTLLAGVFALPVAVYGVLGFFTWRTARRLPVGYPGRARLLTLGGSAGIYGALAVGLHLVAPGLLAPMPKLLVVSVNDAWMTFGEAQRYALGITGVAAVFAANTAFWSAISSWWLVPEKARSRFFLLFDVLLVLTVAYLWGAYLFLEYPAVMKSFRFFKLPDTTGVDALRIGLTFLLGVRVGVRALPYALNVIERLDFRALVAARHLRAKKSGFLAAISFLSILAVSVSSCALTTTLSVMGGFRQDLKKKILGSNAHIVVDRPDGRIDGYDALTELARKVEGVRGVSPYVSGEVMISSASNLAGAVLRGIDVSRIGQVSELPSNMRMGSLDYLAHPEKLARLPTTQLGMGIGTPKVQKLDDDLDVKKAPTGGQLSTQIDRLLDAAHDEIEDKAAAATTASSTLPGIVVGQELARSLRLYLGDEVNVVTPLGELGPTGPMPKSRPFRVAGIFYSGMYEYDMKFAYVTLASAQKFLGTGDRASGIEITVREPDRAQDVAAQIAQKLGGNLRVRPWQELNKNLFGALALEKLAMFIALGIAILVASFCIVGTLTLMVQEKGREVAVLKALGAADRAIVGIFVLEGMLIGVFGSLLGLALGYVVCFAAERFGVALNPEVYYIDRLPVHIDPFEFVSVGLAAVVVCLFVTIYPAKLASRLRPVDALRYE